MKDQDFVAAQYGPRAADYVTSTVHAAGADLDEMEALLAGRAGETLLDLGCGGGHVSYRAAPHAARVVACDVTPAMLEAVRATAAQKGLANIETCKGAAEDLPFPLASFDMVFCRFTAHHWADLQAGLNEVRRVLKPGGLAVFSDTIAPPVRSLDTHLQTIELLRDVSHVRNYSRTEWCAALVVAGFALVSVTERRLRMEFPSWVARTRTPALFQEAIRGLQSGAPERIKSYFDISEDGSFDLDAASFVVRPA